MAWTSLSFPFGSILTSTKMTQLYDNITALANGDSGAPSITTAALAANAVTLDKLNFTQGSWSQSFTVQQDVVMSAYSHWPQMKASAANRLAVYYDGATSSSIALDISYEYQIWCRNYNGTSTTWSGQYHYHDNSKQHIKVIMNKQGQITGIHITDIKNDGEELEYGKGGEIITNEVKLVSIDECEELFEVKKRLYMPDEIICKHTAETIINDKDLMKLLYKAFGNSRLHARKRK